MASAKSFSRFGLYGGASAAVLSLWLAATPAAAQQQMRAFDIKAGDLGPALNAFARQSDQEILFTSALVAGKRTAGVSGRYEPRTALTALLAGTGVQVASANGSVITLRGGDAAGPQDAAAAEPAQVTELVVTGSRIRGASPASPVIVVTAQQMQMAAQHDLGEVVRSLPQNYGGGRNPGAGSGRGTTNNNYGGTSTINLRGIGNDATLTLINGHRLANNVTGGVDIGAIPIVAVDRLEIVPDGASAIYGSDAVGGVANIITKRDYDGFTVSAMYGGSTDGGYREQQYSATGGGTWSGGGAIVGVSASQNTPIRAGQRSYTKLQNPENSIYPDLKRTNLFASVNQDIGEHARFAIDGLYSNILNRTSFAYSAVPLATNGAISKIGTRSYVVAPSLTVSLPHDWSLETYATYGSDQTRYQNFTYTAGRISSVLVRCYCNTTRSVEVNAEGGLWRLPAGEARIAFGGGYRENRTVSTANLNGNPFSQQYHIKDTVNYGFGELNTPLIAPDQNVTLVHALKANLAVRYEAYENVDSVTTPKLGLVYEMTSEVSFKASWGKSFKIPLFSQRYQNPSAILSRVTGYGTLYPADATFISIANGSPNLKPEKATSSTFTAKYQPTQLPGLKLEAGYYHIDFTDRVVYPIPTTAGVLTRSLYAPFITLNPSATAQAAIYGASPTGLTNTTGVAYDPTKVVAIIDQRATNASSQIIDGFDLAVSYRISLANGAALSLATSSTYSDITQKLLPASPTVGVTGNFYQPRHVQSRTGATWEHGPLTVSAFANYVGAARYRNVTPILDIKAVTTLDLVAQWIAPQPIGAAFTLQVANLFNAKPTVVPGGQPFESAFDAPSYAVTGRVISLQATKSF
jgi:outer membrane receptor protein involved in Fe transport